MIKIIILYIIYIKIKVITSNFWVLFTHKNINSLILDKFISNNLNKIYQNSVFFFLFLFKIVTKVGKYHIIFCDTCINWNYNAKVRFKSSVNDLKTKSKNKINKIELRDNILM